MPPAIMHEVARSKVRKYLSGLRGYNPMPDAESLLAEALESVCVNLEHADATLRSFEDQCPTPREIKDAGLNLKEKFQPQPSLRETWEAESGPPDPEWSRKLLNVAVALTGNKDKDWEIQKRQMRLQAITDSLYFTEGPGRQELDAMVGKQERSSSKQFWADAMRHHEREHPEEVAAIRAGREPEIPKPSEPKVLPMRRPITAESFKGVEPMHIERCPNCGGSGRLAGDDYCDECETGRDLRRLESSHGNGTEGES